MTSPESALIAQIAEAMGRSAGELPVYRRLANVLSELVRAGRADGHGALPSERSLAAEIGISRVTVRRALDELALDGLLRRRQGARTVIGDRVEKRLATLMGFSEELRSRGIEPGQRWISHQAAQPTPSEAMALDLSGSELVVRLVRVRLADGVPIAIERAAVPQSVLPSGDLAGGSLYARLAELGAAPIRGVQRIRAGIMARIEADLLECSPGTPLLVVERRCFLADGRPVEFTETRYNPCK